MVAPKGSTGGVPKSRSGPAQTPRDRENQLVSMAYDLAEKRMAEGTASAQEVSFFLKMGSSREVLEQERIRNENALAQAKIEHMASMQRQEELMVEALKAMREYKGVETQDEQGDYGD